MLSYQDRDITIVMTYFMGWGHQTNGICERFHKTMLQEFYQVAFRQNLYKTLEELQSDLDYWLTWYDHDKTHQGKMCCGRPPGRLSLMANRAGTKRSDSLTNRTMPLLNTEDYQIKCELVQVSATQLLILSTSSF